MHIEIDERNATPFFANTQDSECKNQQNSDDLDRDQITAVDSIHRDNPSKFNLSVNTHLQSKSSNRD